MNNINKNGFELIMVFKNVVHVANTLCNCLCKYIANNTDNTFHSFGGESLLWMSFASERTIRAERIEYSV